ncbi:helix-turn-helix domain-containing protein [Marvinbryantia sp.]|uniref:helix-turn-helix domain-containing protein n=2 Tax=Marvinbryantia sp. TaxID=2496532 RepID=UPI0025D52A38|nr:helix-turn-helix domain-containing protein [uncultured Marvinbryantia sp.]
METETRLSLFRDMISCCHNLYLWTYDSAFHLITSNCPEQTIIDNLFVMNRSRDDFIRQIAEQDTPVIYTNEMGLMWVMTPYFLDNELLRFYILGPFFVDDIPPKSLEAQLNKHNLSVPLRQEFMLFLHKLPVISLSRIFEYAIMLYFCITEKKITVSALRYHENTRKINGEFIQRESMDAHGTYKGEQEMLRMVREGDLNYQSHMNKMSITGHLGKLSNGDPLRQMKNAVLVCITLFSRAAIEGGLTPEVSYTLTDHYFQSVEACTAITDLVEIAHTMQDDFIQRVHRCRTSSLSQPVRACCEYISLHLEDRLSLSMLARQTGYTENYLSKKFKQETSLTPNEYIRGQRLEQAAFLLRTTQDDVQNISERLQFCSQSYFADHFRRYFGVTPTEYRKQETH